MKRFLLALVGLAVAGLSGTALARVDADPNRDYAVTAADGAWMICIAVFRGETAPAQAHDLVLEIRSKYNLPAFAYDRTSEERRKQQEDVERQRTKLRQYLEAHGVRPEDVHIPIRTTHIEEECVVLVGSYPDMDSAHTALGEVRQLTSPDAAPRSAAVPSAGGLFGSANADREAQQSPVHPFATSFVVRNPTAPPQPKADQEETARALRNLNSGESFSVYKCPKRWTLAIASYQGASVMASQSASPSLLDKLFGNAGADHMNAAALNAHNLAEALRKLGYQAYVFHTRYRSVVTLDGFDSADDPRMREVHEAIMTRIKKDPRVGLPLFDQVVPMEVPQ